MEKCGIPQYFIVNTLKVTPANIGYHGYTKTTCISPNEVVCHGIPSPNVVLKDGDIINIDVAIIKDGYFGDTSRMYYVGTVKPEAKKLVDTTYEAMVAGIHAVKQGATLGDIGYAIQTDGETREVMRAGPDTGNWGQAGLEHRSPWPSQGSLPSFPSRCSKSRVSKLHL